MSYIKLNPIQDENNMLTKTFKYAVMMIFFISPAVWANGNPLVKGVNYDPVHSLEFAKAVGLDDKAGMIQAINLDLDKIVELHQQGFPEIKYIKTFFSSYSSLGADPTKRVEVNIADIVNDWNIRHSQDTVQLAIGVYEFRPQVDGCKDTATCKLWTIAQINAAIQGANQHPGLIDRIIGGMNYSNAKTYISNYWDHINALNPHMEVIATEEGWPSAGNNISAQGDPLNAHDYLFYWYYRNANVANVTYFFALFDKSPGQGIESHWGIYSADRHSSLLGSPEAKNNYSKPLAKGHVLVNFMNGVGQSGWETPKTVEINVCTQDWNPATQSQGTCYPIDGYNGTGKIGTTDSTFQRTFMIDTTGESYQSLMVIYDSGNLTPRLCYIDHTALTKMTDQTTFVLQWKTPDGAVPC